ncbi:hypothetical protein Tco_0979738 [Tanacetum coccineum]
MDKALEHPLEKEEVDSDEPEGVGVGVGVGSRGLFRHGMILKTLLLGERDHHVIHKIKVIRECMWIGDANILNKSSEKHSIGKSHIGALGHTNHSIDHVVGKIEVFPISKAVEHVAETSIGMVIISHEAYGILTEDDFPLFKIGF